MCQLMFLCFWGDNRSKIGWGQVWESRVWESKSWEPKAWNKLRVQGLGV